LRPLSLWRRATPITPGGPQFITTQRITV